MACQETSEVRDCAEMKEKETFCNAFWGCILEKHISNIQHLRGMEIDNGEVVDLGQQEILNPFSGCDALKTVSMWDFIVGLNDVPSEKKFDYVLAWKVIEYVPDFILFFEKISNCLKEEGVVVLGMSDGHFSSDQKQFETTAGHLIVDHESHGCTDAAVHIIDELIFSQNSFDIHWPEICRRRYDAKEHRHVFSFEGFLERVLRPLIQMRYLPFSLVDYCLTENRDGFYVVLKKCSSEENIEILGEKAELQPVLVPLTEVDIFNMRRQIFEIEKSGLFNSSWYLEKYSDVRSSGVNPIEHYFYQGAFCGYNPSPLFDSHFYLEENSDVKAAGYNPLWHFVHCGKAEGRKPFPEEGK